MARKARKASGYLLLFALVLASLMPSLVAAQGNEQTDSEKKEILPPLVIEKSELWTPEEAGYYASLEIQDFSEANFGNQFLRWKQATVGTVTLVRDTTGSPVLYDVTVTSNDELVGLVQIWAKKSMGVPFHTVSTSNTWTTLRQQENEARKMAIEVLGQVKILTSEMVYTVYPKRAFALTYQKDGKTEQLLVDVTTEQIVLPEQTVPFANMLNSAQLDSSIKTWETVKKEREKRDVATNEVVLSVPLYGQQTDCYCVPATAKMIYQYHKNQSPTQNMLAGTFGTIHCGTPLGNIVPGWNRYRFPAQFTNEKVSWSTVRNEINSGRPLMSGIRYSDGGEHIRAIAGYGTFGTSNQYAYIRDPLPVGQGNSYWEIRATNLEVYYFTVN